ncbi:hypothetical protein [Corynebacterium doosanense]|uniref:hypothetical protein n=1 Tax=Corynebacterium doosanense TaxID=1121358 RepID=UPI00035D504B|nr:hypothetical protein [Corynebacterium doosanense]
MRTFCFHQNLAAQEASGDRLASVSVERVLTRLQGSTESDALLLALVDDSLTPVLAPVGDLGVPVIPATDDERDLEVAAFAYLSIPLLEELRVVEVELVLDAGYLPLPGEELDTDAVSVRAELMRGVEEVCRALGRDVLQLWSDQGAPEHYCPAVTVDQYALRAATPSPRVPDGFSVRVARNYAPVDGLSTLLSTASADADHGHLHTEPVRWTGDRLREAAARLAARGETQLVVLLVDGSGTARALCEFTAHSGADPTVAELGVVSVDRGFRGRGLGHAVLAAGLTNLAPEVQTVYASAAAGDTATARLLAPYTPELLTSATAWQRILP